MDHKIILKCRLCLDDFDESQMYDLFKQDDEEHLMEDEMDMCGDLLKLSEKVEYCCGVRIRESVEMPSKICKKCHEMTKIWFNFRQMCINSQVYLESLCKERSTLLQIGKDNSLEYIVEDLQTFRSLARKNQPAFTIKLEALEEVADDDDEQLLLEADSDDTLLEREHDGTIEVELESVYLQDMPAKEDDDDMEEKIYQQTVKKGAQAAEEAEVLDEIEEPPVHKVTRPPRAAAAKANKKQAEAPTPAKKHYRPPSPTSYMCSICGNVYTKKNSFKYHMSLHSNIKPHQCELCGKSFRHVTELKSHMRRHTGEKPYKCSYCDRHFVDRSERHRHERVHTNTRPYECQICGKTFTYSVILKNHLKYHSGVKDFNCLVCDKSFTLPHQLKAHLQTITHKQKEEQFVASGYEVVYE